jgi:tungstate transport system ATP-binding protein
MSNETIYEIRSLVKSYGTRRVLDIARLDIHRGEVLSLVGPSGAGKSTLLRLLNFLEPSTSGSIRFLDVDLDGGRAVPLALRRRVTTVFQRPILLNRSVEANVRYGLRLRGQSDGGRQVSAALEQVGMAGLARQKAHTLSGGEMQRVSLARAMVLQPDVLLLDEPTANLDPYNVGLIEEIISTLNQEHRTTLVLVTHNVFQARRLAHRVGLLLDGQLIEVDERERFFEQPQDARTIAFVRGEMVY